MFIWPIGIIWHWESGGLRAIHIYVIDFQEISQGSGFLLHKFWWPLTPNFLTAKWSLWVIWTSLHGYFFSAIFFFIWPLLVEAWMLFIFNQIGNLGDLKEASASMAYFSQNNGRRENSPANEKFSECPINFAQKANAGRQCRQWQNW